MGIDWRGAGQLAPRSYVCGHCGRFVGPDKGFWAGDGLNCIYICSHCNRPTYFDAQLNQTPGVVFGNVVLNVPNEIAKLYNEARSCIMVQAYTASVMVCRKILMHIAVAENAQPNLSFLEYVNYLALKNFIPSKGLGWVDHIRKRGNDANHEIQLMERKDAEELISFIEMLLKCNYEFPSKIETQTSK